MKMETNEFIARKKLEKLFGTKLPKRKLVIGHDSDGFCRFHEFDLVAKRQDIVGEVKSCKIGNANFKATLNDCFFLSKIKARRKILVLTNKGFYDDFKKKTDGLISKDVEIILVQA